jgi:RNA polymerase sigma-B factor
MPVGESGGQLADLIGSPDAAIELVADQEAMRDLIDQLPERERRILLERFYGNRTQSDIAADIGISQMHVSRLLSRALAAMRAAMLSDERPALLHSAEAAGPVISVRPQTSGAIRVLLAGEIDRDNAGRLRHELLGLVRRARPDSRMEIDLTAVPLIDAAGINALFGAYQAARARGVAMTLVGMQPFVARIVVESGLRSLMS